MPEGPPDDRFVYLSDVLPTAWQAVEHADVPELDLESYDGGLPDAVRELTDGRGPLAVIDAVGMEAHGATVGKLAQRLAGMLPDTIARPMAEKAGMGQANVKRWIDDLMPLVGDDGDPLGVETFATHHVPLDGAPRAYEIFQSKQDGAFKVPLKP